MKMIGNDQRRLAAAQRRAKPLGFDAMIPNRHQAAMRAEPDRYAVGYTCYCAGTDQEPHAQVLQLGEMAVCPLCGTSFTRLPDNTGIGVEYPHAAG